MPSRLQELKQASAPCRLEQIAASLAHCILAYQKEGPYYLGGWSDSGVVAYETARQIMEEGHEVALLVMFDSPNPAFQQGVLKEAWLDSRAAKMRYLSAELLGVKLKNAPTYVAEKAKELRRRLGVAAPQIQQAIRARRNGDISENSEHVLKVAVRSYRPSPYIGRVAFFKAAEGPTGDAWDYSRGWQHLILGDFVVYEVPGDHRSMFREPNVETLANRMMKYFCSNESRKAAVG